MKKNIALVSGGYSTESTVSFRTASNIAQCLDRTRYNIYNIIITRKNWLHQSESAACIPVDKNDFSITIDGNKITFDAVFMAVYCSPGEDGKLQGYLDMLDIPYTSCEAIESALTFNKGYCSKLVKATGIVKIARSVHLTKAESYSLNVILEELKLPVFVKPTKGGSSVGASKVKLIEEFLPAIEKAFGEDNQVVVEEFIDGRELTISVYKLEGTIHTLPATEIISQNEFFDHDAKVTPGVTRRVTPAPLLETIREQLESTAAAIYRNLNCRGIVRMDFILQQPDNVLYFLEVNTVPNQFETSLVAEQMRQAGVKLDDFYNALLEEALQQHHH